MASTPLGNLVIYGAGGHGLVVAEAATAAGWHVVGFLDDDPQAEAPAGWKLLQRQAALPAQASLHVAIGDNPARRRVTQKMTAEGWRLANVLHPSAVISPSVSLGHGVFIGARAAVNGLADLSSGVIVNSGAIVEHHCEVGEFSHVAPGAILCGRVTIGSEVLVGAGAVILPQRKIAAQAVIGAGAVVVADVPQGACVVGVPARLCPTRTST
jgi:sugar O-acyltransferase (sialic acid O-acetyltransferase NeuD family)